MKKIWIAPLLALLTFGVSTTAAKAATFQDVPKETEMEQRIEELVEKEIITGYGDGTYRPYALVERQQVALLLARALPLEPVREYKGFRDVYVTQSAYPAIERLYRAGVVSGDREGKFNPASALTRAEMAVMLANAFQLEPKSTKRTFQDVPENHWAADAIQALADHGVTKGVRPGHYELSGSVIRGQYALFLHRALSAANGGVIEKPTHTLPTRVPEIQVNDTGIAYYGIRLGDDEAMIRLRFGAPKKVATYREDSYLSPEGNHRFLYYANGAQFEMYQGQVTAIYLPTPYQTALKRYYAAYPKYQVKNHNNSIAYVYEPTTEQLIVMKEDLVFIAFTDANFYEDTGIRPPR